MPRKNSLQDHVFGTYVSLRYGLVAIGVMLPILLWAIGCAHGVGLQPSMSDYYWAGTAGKPPSRDWFVGGLFAVAACLYLYKGFTTAENLALNFAALLGVGVAIFPMAPRGEAIDARFSVHGTCAVLMFLCLVYVVWRCAGNTLSLLKDDVAARFRKTYRFIGFVMLASPLTALGMNLALGGGKAYTFFIEAAGIWAFAAYWVVKSREFKHSKATRRALQGAIETSAEGKGHIVAESAPPECPLAECPLRGGMPPTRR